MAYTIVELQTDAEGNTATPPNRVETARNVATSKWHETCSYAAISNVYLHVVLLLGERGEKLERAEFIHDAPATEEV